MNFTNEANDIERVLFSEEQIQNRVKELAVQITADYAGKDPTVVCILKGASFFYTDLVRNLHFDLFMDFIAVSSYGQESKSTGVVRLVKDLDRSITGRHVILVEDIIDSGLTLRYLETLYESRKPASIKTCVLIDKVGQHDGVNIKADYCGFTMGNEFVVGYGLDCANHYRNLPYIGILKPEVYA